MLKTATTLSFVATVLVSSCVADVSHDEVFVGADGVIDEGVIVGPIDWVDASTLPASSTDRTASKAVAYISIPESHSRCTGFLVGPDVVMTNNHCVPDDASAFGVKVNFRYETRWDETGAVYCDKLIGTDAALDFSLLRCRSRAGDTFGVLRLDETKLARNDAINLIHQNCDYFTNADCEPTKKLSPGHILSSGVKQVQHDADMLGGSSGSPILLPGTTRVVALNNAHVVSDEVNGRGTINLAVPMSAIVPVIRTRFPDVLTLAAAPPVEACAAIPDAGRIVDEDDGCVTLGGDTRWLRSVEDAGYDNDLVWTGTTNKTTVGNFIRWNLNVATAGTYELSAFLDSRYASASSARYRVHHGGVDDVLTVSQRVSGSGFFVLGSFAFAAGADQWVELDDNTGVRSEQLMFDAVQLTPTTTPAPPVTPPPPTETPPADSCAQVQLTGADGLNVRPQASTGQAPVGTLARNEIVERLDTVEGQLVRGSTQWHRIRKSNGVTGYVSAVYMTCTAP